VVEDEVGDQEPSVKPDPFLDFVLEQLEQAGRGTGTKSLKGFPVTARAMFGGHGLYQHGVFFGIVYRRDLYFKTSDSSRPKYVKAGMSAFRPSAKQTSKSYYQVPAQVLESPTTLEAWAAEAVESAKAARKLPGRP
jgi:DNA transformation protein